MFNTQRYAFKLCLSRNKIVFYSETLNNEYIERIHQMSYSSLSDYGYLDI